jgi:hypothetical protein
MKKFLKKVYSEMTLIIDLKTSDLALTHAMYNNYDIKLHVATFLQDCHTIEARSGL